MHFCLKFAGWVVYAILFVSYVQWYMPHCLYTCDAPANQIEVEYQTVFDPNGQLPPRMTLAMCVFLNGTKTDWTPHCPPTPPPQWWNVTSLVAFSVVSSIVLIEFCRWTDELNASNGSNEVVAESGKV